MIYQRILCLFLCLRCVCRQRPTNNVPIHHPLLHRNFCCVCNKNIITDFIHVYQCSLASYLNAEDESLHALERVENNTNSAFTCNKY